MNLFSVANADQRLAVCNDGSPATYYFRPGAQGAETSWVIHLQGGGFCFDSSSCGERARSSPNFMTSQGEPRTRNGNGVHSTGSALNPDFYAANHVYVNYCSSDLWSGDRAASNQTGGFHFRGLRIFRAVIEDLMNPAIIGTADLSEAKTVLLSGSSAGGGGVQVHLDWLADTLPRATVKGVNDAGWFIQTEPFRSSVPSPSDRSRMGFALWNGTVDASCAAANRGQEFLCYLGPVVYPFIETPLLIQIAQFDGPQLVGLGITLPIDSAEEAFALDFAAAIRSSLGPVEAAFSPATRTHGLLAESDFWSLRIDRISLRDVLSNWFFGRSGSVKIIED